MNQFRFHKVAIGGILALILLTGCSKLPENQVDGSITALDPSLELTSYKCEKSSLTCEYELLAPQNATYLQINVEQYSSGATKQLFTGGVSIGDERLPVSRLAGSITANTTNNHSLSLVIDLIDAGTIEYTIPIDTLDASFNSTVMTTPIVPAVNELIRLVELKPRGSDNTSFLAIEMILGDEDEVFASIRNS